MTTPIEYDLVILRDALWQLEEAAAHHLETPTPETAARLRQVLAIAERAGDEGEAMSKSAVLQVSCDSCDAYDDFEMVRTCNYDYYDGSGAMGEARSLGWHFGADGSVYCAECWTKDREPRVPRKRKAVVVPEGQGALL